ncbi:Serine/threonine-protein kinase ATG1 [Scheffersomyces coipomensis]|uniref:Serine/threonine-protein kinase ATG1 n=1 Tax=Scheffersomyces coipomensis TaxID=1788519 RepID=UPI00315D3A0B
MINTNSHRHTNDISTTSTTNTIGIYSVGPEIGKGSFATVYKCYNKNTHTAVAIKSVVRSKLKSKKLVENLEIEISILKSMKHPHIVGLLDYIQTASHFHLVMDYCSMGDLSYFIRKRPQLIKTHPVISSLLERYPSPEGSYGLNENLVIHFLKQLSSALQFLRDKSLVHRDIKPQNLLLCPPLHSKQQFQDDHYVGLWELPILKIADFGFARFLPSTSMAETLCGSPLYMAPEILRYEKYNAKADLWSVGAVLYEMTVGKPPFKAGNHIELLRNIEKAQDRIKFPSGNQISEELKSLIRSLLKYNPTERISFNEFFHDPLIVNELPSNDVPLETSTNIDENLFISEYISPIKPSERSQYIQPITTLTPYKEESKPSTSSDAKHSQHSDKIPSSASSSVRDEEIKQIINKNSPAPESSIHHKSVHKSVIRNKDDIILEKDYVVVEKRAVEVNAIADELAHAGSGAVAINHTNSGTTPGSRKSSAGSIGSVNDYTSAVRYRRSSSGSQRRPSFADRRISISISPSNALSKAIGLASNKLFGSPTSANIPEEALLNKINGDINNYSFSTIYSSPNFADHLLLQKLNLPTLASLNLSNGSDKLIINGNELEQQHQQQLSKSKQLTDDEIVLQKLETLATKSHAIKLFADVKFSQLIPSPPSSDGFDDDLLHPNDMLPPTMIKAISEEGVALYVKTLSILNRGMSIASDWWYSSQAEQQQQQSQSDLRNMRSDASKAQIRINDLVQWIREKFNESLEKAEFIKQRLEEAKRLIAEDQIISSRSISPGFDDEDDKVMAEKLIFDRALEISRNAAVNELVQEDLKGCELAYGTAIWMLEALIDESDSYGDDKESKEQKLDIQDKAMVEKFIVSIGNRLSVLKKKLELI